MDKSEPEPQKGDVKQRKFKLLWLLTALFATLTAVATILTILDSETFQNFVGAKPASSRTVHSATPAFVPDVQTNPLLAASAATTAKNGTRKQVKDSQARFPELEKLLKQVASEHAIEIIGTSHEATVSFLHVDIDCCSKTAHDAFISALLDKYNLELQGNSAWSQCTAEIIVEISDAEVQKAKEKAVSLIFDGQDEMRRLQSEGSTDLSRMKKLDLEKTEQNKEVTRLDLAFEKRVELIWQQIQSGIAGVKILEAIGPERLIGTPSGSRITLNVSVTSNKHLSDLLKTLRNEKGTEVTCSPTQSGPAIDVRFPLGPLQ